MNLNKLSKPQAELDLQINLERQIDHTEYLKEKAIALCVELGELMNEREFIFKYWKTHNGGDREKAITEYVDGIHFLLSYGNSIKFDFEKFEYKQPNVLDQRDLILGLFNMLGALPFHKLKLTSEIVFRDTLNHYLLLAEKLNFTFEEIEEAYFKKNGINHSRVENGY